MSAIMAGLLVGNAWPGVGPIFETLLWPTLMLLLYATFIFLWVRAVVAGRAERARR